MFTTHSPYLSSEIEYRREELRRAWGRPARPRHKVVRPTTPGSTRVAIAR
ncbi:hypothetical protein MWU75_03490 [Ornithinimicrobium sp. F0845]|nr:hypothetical protein [Ornithinimicrobium sp. F0845]MCK0111201.1 hypothetical protein [Ornithinimicrobium sp. F0845]